MSLFRSENNAVQNIIGQMQQLISIAISLQQIIDKLDNESALRHQCTRAPRNLVGSLHVKGSSDHHKRQYCTHHQCHTVYIMALRGHSPSKSIPGVNQMTDIIKIWLQMQL